MPHRIRRRLYRALCCRAKDRQQPMSLAGLQVNHAGWSAEQDIALRGPHPPERGQDAHLSNLLHPLPVLSCDKGSLGQLSLHSLRETIDETRNLSDPLLRIGHCSGNDRLGRRNVDKAISVDALRLACSRLIALARELLQHRYRDLADPLQQWHDLFHRWRCRLVHWPADANIATLYQGLEVGDGPVKKGLIGVRHQACLQLWHHA